MRKYFRRGGKPWVGGGSGECNPFIQTLKLPSFPLGSSQPTWYRNKPNRCLLIKQDERKSSFALWPWVNWWLRWANAIVVEEKCKRGFSERSGGNAWACALTLFLCGEISSLIRAHLLRVFSLLQIQTHLKWDLKHFLLKHKSSHRQKHVWWKKRWNTTEKLKRGRERQRGSSGCSQAG